MPRAIAKAGADAVIVQDLGLIAPAPADGPFVADPRVDANDADRAWGDRVSPRAGCQPGHSGARAFACRAGPADSAGRRCPLRSSSTGPLCISFSGQCLASESFWGRSANRGLCGQACRLPYQLVVDGRPYALGDREYLLSPHDLAAYDRLPQLVELGVAAFKIEGRLKSAAYVAATTRVYRAALMQPSATSRSPFRQSTPKSCRRAFARVRAWIPRRGQSPGARTGPLP